MINDVLDEAYARWHRWGPEFGAENGLSNHAPMAVEVLSRRGYDDQVDSWLDRYVARLETMPAEDDPISLLEALYKRLYPNPNRQFGAIHWLL